MSADYPSMTTAEIRSKFLNFFEERGLKLYPCLLYTSDAADD